MLTPKRPETNAQQKKAPLTKHKKPRCEQLLDRIDKNPSYRETWNELAREPPTKVRKETKHHPASTEVASSETANLFGAPSRTAQGAISATI
jgi:hypothetical protein